MNKEIPEIRTSPLSAPVRMWYRSHANDWYEALPLGNGRLGAMVHGRVVRERIQLNEETLWEGQRFDRAIYRILTRRSFLASLVHLKTHDRVWRRSADRGILWIRLPK